MDRRNFLRNSALASVPLLLKGIPVFAGSGLSNPFLNALARPTNTCDKILVIIQLNGGNDGLNTVIPLDKYTQLSAARSNLLVPSSSVLTLNSAGTTGLHPSMTEIKSLYDAGKVCIVQGVSYPNPNFSHFQAQDIWFTGSNPSTLETGWLGRDLDIAFPNYPTNYPNTTDPDPPAIQIGGATATSLQGANTNMGYNAPNPASLLNVVNGTTGTLPTSDYGTELGFLRLMKDQSNAYAGRITSAYNAQATQSTQYPTSGANALADQLKIVARLIGGGLETPVYIVNHSDSFDTHVSQVVSGSTATGTHANALAKLSAAVSAFQDDITLMGKANYVTGMTFSEFGRRVISNTSIGTDHGTAAPVFFFGAGVNGGIIGSNADLPAAPTSSTQVPTQYDFRQLYASVMQDWLCLSATESDSVLNGSYSTLAIFNQSNPLPLGTIALAGVWDRTTTTLNFTVQSNAMYDAFFVERLVDGMDYEEVSKVRQLSDDATDSYKKVFDTPNVSLIYYRIKGITKQQKVQYSNVLRLEFENAVQHVSVYPNPVRNYKFTIEFHDDVKSNVEVAIYGSGGQKLFYNQYNPTRKINVQLPDMFAKSTLYVLRIKYDNIETNEKLVFE
ncbi:MAG: DUF1501 domain-containing protein [Edaphocola sp.]